MALTILCPHFGKLNQSAVTGDMIAWPCRRLGVPVAIASSSPRDWIERHLTPRGLLNRFATMSCAGGGMAGKPDPAVYLDACRMLGADPTRSLAFEDSPNGVNAAKSAGMTCVAVPTAIGKLLDFTHADVVAESLADLTIEQLATAN